jgi:type IV pilus assembly protein PilV
MVTILVLALGLLGLASLQVFSLKNNHVSYYRAIASQQAYDMEDRIRANLVGVDLNSYDNLTSAIPADPGCVNTAGGCTYDTMAISDQRQWLMANAALLPSGSGVVRCLKGPATAANLTNCVTANSGVPRVFCVVVSWREKDNVPPPSTDPDCGAFCPAGATCFITRFSP